MAQTVTDYSLAEIADLLDAQLLGDGKVRIHGLNTLQDASAGELAFLANPRYERHLSTCQASAVILHPSLADAFAGNKLLLDNPYLGYARLTASFNNDLSVAGIIHPSAVVHPDAELHPTVTIGANAVIEAGAQLQAGVVIGPGCVVGADTLIGEHTRLFANVTLYSGVTIGAHCRLHSGSVIGADGFGFAPSRQGWVKIYQLGSVVIGNRVEIGASTTIDRGALGDTRIGDGVILDNQIQIGHNVEIGENTAIAACAAIAGSTRIGRNCTIAGGAGLVGHISVCDGVHITAMSMVTKSIDTPGSYSSGTGMDNTGQWRKNAARFAQLDSLVRRLTRLEKSQKG